MAGSRRPGIAFLMTSDESIRTDASTVHRTGNQPPEYVAAGSVEAEQIAEAKTVIRGSSRAARNHQRDALDRTPMAVAKVLLGQRLDHFLLEELIGGGGMGAVFRAHDEQLDRTVAIKVIPFVGDDPDLQRRFRNEAQSAAKLDHPRIARVFDAGIYDEWHYIVFEYIEGTNIRDLVTSSGVLSIDEAVFYTSQLADALQHAADRGIVHRDIKPSNVLIGDAGKIKLVDMGLARSDNIDLSEDMTASGVTLGTFDYISPEQAHDPRDADFRSDIYSLGCTLYFMLTGSPPYPGGTMLQKLLSHGNAPPPDARELRPEVSHNLARVIEKMLAKNPADRYQTAKDLIADLREVAFRDGLVRAQAIGPVPISQPNPMITWIETHAPWVAAAMLLIISAGWLHLESAAMRVNIEISPTARRLLAAPIKPVREEASGEGGLNSSSAQPESGLAGDPGMSNNSPPPESDPASEPYEPAETPPKLDFTAPNELIEETSPTANIEMAIDAAEEDDPFVRSLFDEESDVSIEPLEDPFPHVVRLIGSRLEQGNDRDVDGAALAGSLSQALDLAARYGASRVEIAVPTVYSEPVRVQADNLRVTSTVGGSTIIFQSPDSLAMERSNMFSIGSYQVELEDLHFVWNVPVSDIDGGTLFDINSNGMVKLTDCSVTISNPTSRDKVYAFDVITDPERFERSARESVTQTDEFPLVTVELYNVVVRGSMTMLHMDYAAKLWLSWDNGLLAITDRLIDTAGARLQPPETSGPIRLTLTRVTAHAPRGLVRMRVGVDGAYPVPVNRSARKCVFLVDEATPHFEVTGLAALEDQSPLLELNGAFNAYVVDPATDILFRMASSSGEDEQVTRIGELATWPDENSPKWDISWSQVRLSDAPASLRSPTDYAQEGASPPGFDDKYLPDEGLLGVSQSINPQLNPL
jgi:serine/threonine protein kinase